MESLPGFGVSSGEFLESAVGLRPRVGCLGSERPSEAVLQLAGLDHQRLVQFGVDKTSRMCILEVVGAL